MYLSKMVQDFLKPYALTLGAYFIYKENGGFTEYIEREHNIEIDANTPIYLEL